jgi:hypothetical protein
MSPVVRRELNDQSALIGDSHAKKRRISTTASCCFAGNEAGVKIMDLISDELLS